MKSFSLPKTKHKISKETLTDLYLTQRRSVASISMRFKCSENKINYWLSKYSIKKRTISDAMYVLKNPLGDPFIVRGPKTLKEGLLFGLGLGLYWGEGAKRGKGGLRITNTDIKMLKKFIEFLEMFFNIDKNRLKLSIQIFNDISPSEAINFWSKGLAIKKTQFYKPTIVQVRGVGTYKYKSEYGVAILHFNNVKLKKILCDMIDNIH